MHITAGSVLTLVFFMAISLPMTQRWAESGMTALLAAGAISLLVSVSVLIHEIAHMFVGRAFGNRATELSLTLMGGHASFERPFARPGHSALVAAAGPISNLAVAGLWFLAAQTLAPGSLVYESVSFLVTMNLALGLFNLLPAYPLDGGAVTEAAIWAGTGDRGRATSMTATIGQGLAVAIVALAFAVPMVRGELPNYTYIIWAVLVAVILWQGSRGIKRSLAARAWLAERSVRDFLAPIVALPQGATVGELDRIWAAHEGVAVVVLGAGGRPAGYPVPQAVAAVPAAQRDATPIVQVSAALEPLAIINVDGDLRDLLARSAQLGGRLPFFVVMDGTNTVGSVDTRIAGGISN